MGAALPAGDVPGHDLYRQLRRLQVEHDHNDRTQVADLELHRAQAGHPGGCPRGCSEGDPLLGAAVGPYPFNSAGIVVKDTDVGYALETQNRPVFDNDEGETVDDLTNVHEWAHQWYGNSVTLSKWVDIWLNEGFATYAEWLWDASHGGPSTAETFQKEYDSHLDPPLDPKEDNLWTPAPAAFDDPADLFGSQGYLRGAMTLEVLRQKVGSHDFFVILRKWAKQNAYGNVSTPEFIGLSERVSGQDLDVLFKAWLFTEGKPALS